LVDSLPLKPLKFAEIVQLEDSLKKCFPNLVIDGLEKRLQSEVIEEDLAAIYKSRSKKYESLLIPGVAIGLVKKPVGSRGVLNELTLLARQNRSTPLLQELFFPKETKKRAIKEKDILVPVSLSDSQKEVFNRVEEYKMTLVIGPPGTGKSFTIAALATDYISQGKSVLVASKNNQAGKVIAHKIETVFGLKGIVIKTARKTYKRSLQTRLKNILNGVTLRKVDKLNLKKSNSEINALTKQIKQLTAQLITKEKEEISWGRFFYENKRNFISLFRKKWIEYKYNNSQPVWKIKASLDEAENKRNKKIKKYIKERYDAHLYNTLAGKRNEIKHLINALSEDIGNLIQENFDKLDFSIVLQALPAWICNTTDIHQILPLEKEIFDLLIIDEATQCDIASIIPLMYRAKKIVVVGDPKQLRHISFLSAKQQAILKENNGLAATTIDYRKDSILDLVNQSIGSQEQVIFLDEHYRSLPDIIAFSNNAFYENKLTIMTAAPTTLMEKNIFLKVFDGTRDEKGCNKKEAELILAELKEHIHTAASLDKKMCKSIGILSPFRAQVNLLKSMLRETVDLNAIKRHQILIGTPYHFQGEERDIMFLSFVVDDSTHPSTYIYLNKADVFNVSITRARNRQIVFASVDYQKLNPSYLLPQYLSSIRQQQQIPLHENEVYDLFAEQVIALVEMWKVDTILKSYPVAGTDIDLVVVNNNKTYCIDLIGYPGELEGQFSLSKIQLLNRMNFQLFFLPYSAWHLDREKCIDNLSRFLGVEKI